MDQRLVRPKLYSNCTYFKALLRDHLYKLRVFLKSIFRLMDGGLNVPDHTTLSRRNSTLKTKLKRVGKPRGNYSIGLVIHGEDRLIRHTYGEGKHRG